MRYLVTDPVQWVMSGRNKVPFLTCPVPVCQCSLFRALFNVSPIYVLCNDIFLFIFVHHGRNHSGKKNHMRELLETTHIGLDCIREPFPEA